MLAAARSQAWLCIEGPRLTCHPCLLTSCFSGRSLRSCLRTSTSNLVLFPARIMAVTSSLELEGREGGGGRGWHEPWPSASWDPARLGQPWAHSPTLVSAGFLPLPRESQDTEKADHLPR